MGHSLAQVAPPCFSRWFPNIWGQLPSLAAKRPAALVSAHLPFSVNVHASRGPWDCCKPISQQVHDKAQLHRLPMRRRGSGALQCLGTGQCLSRACPWSCVHAHGSISGALSDPLS